MYLSHGLWPEDDDGSRAYCIALIAFFVFHPEAEYSSIRADTARLDGEVVERHNHFAVKIIYAWGIAGNAVLQGICEIRAGAAGCDLTHPDGIIKITFFVCQPHGDLQTAVDRNNI